MSEDRKINGKSIADIVLGSSVGEHVHAFGQLNINEREEIRKARVALREWIGEHAEDIFAKLDDTCILSVLIEEFAFFAMFLGEALRKEAIEQGRADVFTVMGRGNA